MNFTRLCRVGVSSTITFFVLGLAPLGAQSVLDPTTAEFEPSSDHNATGSTGVAIVDHYDLEFYLVGATQPFQTASVGKPSPQKDGKIRVSLSTVTRPSPGIEYVATVAAVGPGGVARSAPSNTFSFSLSLACAYGVTPTSLSVGASGGTPTVSVTTPSGCTWAATSNVTWLTITSGTSGNGGGTVGLQVAANSSSSARSGSATVAGQLVSVSQSGGCGYAVSPTSQTFDAAGGSATAQVSAGGGCAWTAASDVGWLTIVSGASGSGNGTVTYMAEANDTSSSRTGTLVVAGHSVIATQNAPSKKGPPSKPTGLRIGPGDNNGRGRGKR